MSGRIHQQDATGVLATNDLGDVSELFASAYPADASAGYAPGCICKLTTGVVGATLYVNEGSRTSCDFNLTFTPGAFTATVTEINQACDSSGRIQPGGSALTLTSAYNGQTVKLDTAAGTTVTLPAATGTGDIFRFYISTIATSNSHVIKVANASDTMIGVVGIISDNAPTAIIGFKASGTDDTITLNRTTTGSTALGEWLEIQDVATNLFLVKGLLMGTGTEATPFSATV